MWQSPTPTLVEKGSVGIKRACLCQWIMHMGIFGPHPGNGWTLESKTFINVVYGLPRAIAHPVALVSRRQTQNLCVFFRRMIIHSYITMTFYFTCINTTKETESGTGATAPLQMWLITLLSRSGGVTDVWQTQRPQYTEMAEVPPLLTVARRSGVQVQTPVARRLAFRSQLFRHTRPCPEVSGKGPESIFGECTIR